MRPPSTLRIGSRGSPMALAQVERVRQMIEVSAPEVGVEVVPISTSGDRWQGDLSLLGGKAAFVKEVDAALLAGTVDLVVHCVKDIPGDVPAPDGTVIPAYLARDDVRDCLVHPGGLLMDDLPEGSRIGTSAVRRVAQLASRWPHLTPIPIRGNANSRLAKLDQGEQYDALLLAVSGLERIGLTNRIAQTFDVETMVPAVGAGSLALRVREDDDFAVQLVAAFDDPDTRQETVAERTMLGVLRGSCHSPIAALAQVSYGGQIALRARVMSRDGQVVLDAYEQGPDPEVLGTSVATSLLNRGARDLLDDISS